MPRASKRARHCQLIARNRTQIAHIKDNESENSFPQGDEEALSELEGVVAVDEDEEGSADSERFQEEFSQAILQLAFDRLLSEGNPSVQSFLSWNVEAPTKVVHRGRGGNGDSLRTSQREALNKHKLAQAAKACVSMNNFVSRRFPPTGGVNTAGVVDEDCLSDVDELDVDDGRLPIKLTYAEGLTRLNENKIKLTSKRKANDLIPFDLLQRISVEKYFTHLMAGAQMMEASFEAARGVFNNIASPKAYKCTCVREWGDYFLTYGQFKEWQQGKHPKTYSIIHDQDVCKTLRNHIRDLDELSRTPENFTTILNEELLRTIPRAPENVSVDTVRRWMKFLGFQPKNASLKGCFVDGHERDDVVEHRGRFLADMQEYERRMATYAGDDLGTTVAPELQPGTKRVILVTNDESVFYSNDAKRVVWVEEDADVLRPKSLGQSIMVSAFVCECHGFLCGEVNGIMKRSYTTIKPGKNRDGWWTMEKLIAQLDDVIPLFKYYHPDCELLFAFDNSNNHKAMKPDALVASRLKKNDSGKLPDHIMRPSPTVMINGEPQKFVFDNGTEKGIFTILRERGLVVPAEFRKLLLTCGACEARPRGQDAFDNVRCCCTHILNNQEDFRKQKIWLEEKLNSAGVKVIFYPKFHCELNYIELMWSRLKHSLRKECRFSFQDLERRLPELIEAFPVHQAKRSLQHCLRFMDGYRKGLTGKLLQYTVKKYRGHRMLMNFDRAACELGYAAYKETMKKKKNKKK